MRVRPLLVLPPLLAGCAIGTGILPVGPDTYTVREEVRPDPWRRDRRRTGGAYRGKRLLRATEPSVPSGRHGDAPTMESVGADRLQRDVSVRVAR